MGARPVHLYVGADRTRSFQLCRCYVYQMLCHHPKVPVFLHPFQFRLCTPTIAWKFGRLFLFITFCVLFFLERTRFCALQMPIGFCYCRQSPVIRFDVDFVLLYEAIDCFLLSLIPTFICRPLIWEYYCCWLLPFRIAWHSQWNANNQIKCVALKNTFLSY